MTKIESAIIIVKQEGSCNLPVRIICLDCALALEDGRCAATASLETLERKLEEAKKFIKNEIHRYTN